MLKWYHRLSFKVFLQGTVIFIMVAVALYWHNLTVKKYIVETSLKQAKMLAEGVNSALLSFISQVPEGGAFIDEFIIKLNGQMEGAQVRMVHSESITAQYGEEKPEIPRGEKEALSLKDGESRFYRGERMFRYSVPVKAGSGCVKCHLKPDGSGPVEPGYVLGLAIAEVPTDRMEMTVNALRANSIKLLGVVLLTLLAQSIFLNRRLSAPLAGMAEAMDRFRASGRHIRVEEERKDELGALAAHFNKMAEEIERSVKELEEWNVKLESEVERKTETVRRQSERINAMKEYYRSVLESSPNLIVTIDRDLIIDFVYGDLEGAAARAGLELKKEDVYGSSLLDFVCGDAEEEYRDICSGLIRESDRQSYSIYRTEFSLGKKGDEVEVFLTVSPLVDSGKNTIGLVLILSDITQRKRAERELALEKEKLKAIMHGMGAGVLMAADDGTIIFSNQEMEEMFGRPVTGRKCYEVINREEHVCTGGDIDNLPPEGRSLEVRGDNGRYYLIKQTPVMHPGAGGRLIEVVEDITPLKQMEERLRELTITDNLTGLFNKRHFMQKLTEEVARARRHGTSLSLLFMDIDRFKRFNDTYGHMEGDHCLARMGEVIGSNIRAHIDSGYRYGGEEFTVLLPGAHQGEAVEIAERIRESFADSVFTPETDGKKVEVRKTVSLGVAVYKGEDEDKFVERSDQAMYKAKREGGNRIRVAE